ncbi:MAG TPA: APC family permease [Proteobacteria bacterium]|nr:APC family permease [Pseudomonadota bacterium]
MLIKRKNNPPNLLPRFLRDKNPRFIVPVISIKTTGIPKDFGRGNSDTGA